jgi:YebC/PmpR family DNA-binding regulatory protein
MGRAFEFRKARKMKRWGAMARSFTKLGREIVIAVKSGGPDPDTNSKLRAVMQNAKAVNMPKDRVEAAIKRASEKDQANYEEVIYEGYGPHGVPVLVETATDNPTRTVANVRMYFNRAGGELGKSGSVGFMFERKGIFKVNAKGLDKDSTELELIDGGAEEFTWEEDSTELIIQTGFNDFGAMQKLLEEKKFEVLSSQKIFIPTTTKEISDEQAEELLAMIEKLEEDDDILAVYHNFQ